MEEDHVIVPFKRLFGQKESLYNIHAIEDCEMYGIRYKDILHVLEAQSSSAAYPYHYYPPVPQS